MQKNFDKLYYLSWNDEDDWWLMDELVMMDSFIFCGRNRWFYFTEKVHEDCESFENVKLVKWTFKKLDPKWIDYDEELELNLVYAY